MTESQTAELRRDVSKYLAILQVSGSEAEHSQATEKTPPHLELIDFDLLQQTLEKTVSALDAALIREEEVGFMRSWLNERITALQRARNAILPCAKDDNHAGELEKTMLPELVVKFEEESARLRNTINMHPGKSQVYKSADDYRQFKS